MALFSALRTDVEIPAVNSGIPLPPPKGPECAFERKYPWLEMKVGDSFLVEISQRKFGNRVHNARKRYGIKLKTRAVMVNGIQCTRIWRVA